MAKMLIIYIRFKPNSQWDNKHSSVLKSIDINKQFNMQSAINRNSQAFNEIREEDI